MLVKNRRLSDSSSTAIVLYSCSVVDSVGLHRTSREKQTLVGLGPSVYRTALRRACAPPTSNAIGSAETGDLEEPLHAADRPVLRLGCVLWCAPARESRPGAVRVAPVHPRPRTTLDCPRSPNADRRRGRRARRRGGLGGACHVLVRGARQIDQTHQCDDQGRIGAGRAYTAAAGGHVLHRRPRQYLVGASGGD